MPTKAKSKRGGPRRGAGRKPTNPREHVNDKATEDLTVNYDNLRRLANGEAQLVDEVWAPAGTVKRGTGKGSVPVFPDKDPNELVVVRRRVVRLAPDRAANEYLTDRVLGRPKPETPTQPEQAQAGMLDLSNLSQDEIQTLNRILSKCPPKE